jgi:hypothetical protein
MTFPSDILLVEGDTTPFRAPVAGQVLFYAKTNGNFYSLNSLGVETQIGAGTGSVTSVGLTSTGSTITITGTPSPITSSGTFNVDLPVIGTLTPGTYTAANITIDAYGRITVAASGSGGGGGTVTSVSVVTANGFAGSVAMAPTTPAITLSTTVTGMLYGNGTSISAATVADINAVGQLNQNTTGNAATATSATTATTATNIASGIINQIPYQSSTNSTSFIVAPSIASTFLQWNGSAFVWAPGTGGSGVTTFSGGSTGLTPASPTSGPVTLGGTLAIAYGGTGNNTPQSALTALLPVQGVGTVGQVLQSNGTFASWQTTSGSGTVTSVGIAGTNGIGTSGTNPITTSGTITLSLGNITPTSITTSGNIQSTAGNISAVGIITATAQFSGPGTGLTGFATSLGIGGNAATSTLATSATNVAGGSARQIVYQTGAGATGFIVAPGVSNTFLQWNGTSFGWATAGGGSGTVTSVGVSSTGGTITVTGTNPVTTAGTINVDLPASGVTPGTYTNSTVTVDTYGRVTSASSGAGGVSTFEKVVFQYSAVGDFTGSPVISQTSGVAPNVIDGPNCIATYTFTGHTTPIKSMTFYGQVYATNNFIVMDAMNPYGAPGSYGYVVGGGTAGSPSIITGFSSTNVLTLQSRQSDTGAANGGPGQNAYLIVLFGF